MPDEYARLAEQTRKIENEMGFQAELQQLINRYSQENGSGTPDFILAGYLSDCLKAWNQAINEREKWYGREQDRFGMPQKPMPGAGSASGPTGLRIETPFDIDMEAKRNA